MFKVLILKLFYRSSIQKKKKSGTAQLSEYREKSTVLNDHVWFFCGKHLLGQ